MLPAPNYAPRRHGEVASEISDRYERGRASNALWEAGVLFHVLDAYESDAAPWHICSECDRVDTLSATTISRKWPTLFNGKYGISGMLMAPDTEILCAFPSAPPPALLSPWCRDASTARPDSAKLLMDGPPRQAH